MNQYGPGTQDCAAGYVQKYAPNPHRKAAEGPADSAPANAESNSAQAGPSPDCDITQGNEKKGGGDSDSDDDMSGLLSDSDDE